MAKDVDDRVVAVLRSVWWLPVLRGVLLLVLGLLLLVEPLGTLVALVWVFGVFAVADGVVVLLQALLARGRPGFGWVVAQGLVSVGFGALIMLWPGATALVLYYLLALWVLVLGVTALVVAATQYRARDLAWVGTTMLGLIGFLFGLLLAIKPQGSVTVILTVYGLFAFVAGAVVVVAGFATRSLGRQLAAATRGGSSAASSAPTPPSAGPSSSRPTSPRPASPGASSSGPSSSGPTSTGGSAPA